MEIGSILDLAILGGLAVLGVAWRSFSAGAEQAAKDRAAEIVREINRSAVLARELERIRGTERQELRFTSYGKLWAAMRPLAIYDESPVNREAMKQLSGKLSDWYFSDAGGLMLTSHNRDLYFALQDLVSDVGKADIDWDAERTDDPKPIFQRHLQDRQLSRAITLLQHLEVARTSDWPAADFDDLARGWHEDIRRLARDWADVARTDRFAVLQQVSSVLRTGLTYDVESRLR